ncbi:MAG TPA: DinB family protein [Gemmatimonadaceae bacterium]|nr:DinB family protein [Gemmatimonadaceae bacterium]
MRTRSLAVALALAAATPAYAQGWMAEMHRDVNEVQSKILQLANAMPEASYKWQPKGARTMGEVFLHIASDNYYIPISMGKPAPAATGITAEYTTTTTYEKKPLNKAQIVAELTASFTHLHQGMALTTDANAGEVIKFFGSDWSRMRAMVLTVTHLHEHLGQAIAYARSNGVVPPWSK